MALSPDPRAPQFEATGARERIQEFSAQLQGSTLTFEFGFTGSADELSDRAGYRQAHRALGRKPTLLVDMKSLADSESAGDPTLPGPVALVAGSESRQDDGLEMSLLVSLAGER